jgi:hypothetical protein
VPFLCSNCHFTIQESILIVPVIVMLVFMMPTMPSIVVMFVFVIITTITPRHTSRLIITANSRTGTATNRTTDNGSLTTADFRANGRTGTTADCAAQSVISQVSIRSAGGDQQQSQ